MFRFIALAWAPDATAQCATSQLITQRLLEGDSSWRCVLDAVGLQVFCNGTQPGLDSALCLANKRGVVVGSIFKKPADGAMNYASVVSSFNASESEEILTSQGRVLTRSYWGWYVAFLTETPGCTKCVVRGPMSEMQCFHVGLRGMHIMFSWIEDIVQLGLVDLTIDWDHITLHSEFGYATRIGESALNEVTPLTSGQCMELRKNGSVTSTTYWDPCKIANSTWLEDEAIAVDAVHATTRSCVEAWASFHSDIILRLSGGLDSAIVMSCLRSVSHSPRMTSVNYFGEESSTEPRFTDVGNSRGRAKTCSRPERDRNLYGNDGRRAFRDKYLFVASGRLPRSTRNWRSICKSCSRRRRVSQSLRVEGHRASYSRQLVFDTKGKSQPLRPLK